jgi:hypothetical protein
MSLFRLFAYAVRPQRTDDPAAFEPPEGSHISVNATLSAALDDALAQADGKQTRVNLRVALDGSRASELRESVMDFVFAESNPGAAPAARVLADRLSRSMDHRSSPSCLFLIAGYRTDARAAQRQVALWVFPRDAAFRFESGRHRIDIIEDSFSRTSMQRKLALFKGRNVRGQFHVADVLDFQARGRPGRIAEFWIENFLEADAAMSDDAGTRFLADIFASASAKLTNATDIDQVQAAVMALRHAPATRRSIESIGNEFLDNAARTAFNEQAAALLPDVGARRTAFQLDRERFGAQLNFRAFRLSEGTRVVTPIGTIGNTVSIETRPGADGNVDVLTVEDVIVDDKIR